MGRGRERRARIKGLVGLVVLLPAMVVAGSNAGWRQGRVVLVEQGTGNRQMRPPFAVRHAPWSLSWQFDCSRASAGKRHVVLSLADAGISRVSVTSNGGSERVAVGATVPPGDVRAGRLLRLRHGVTSGSVTVYETGQLYTIVIHTACRWSIGVAEIPGPDPLRGTWRYLRTVPRLEVEVMSVRFQAIHGRVRLDRAAAIRRAGRYFRNPHSIRESLLARVYVSGPANGCVCWTLVRRPRGNITADLVFVDANTGSWRGEISVPEEMSAM